MKKVLVWVTAFLIGGFGLSAEEGEKPPSPFKKVAADAFYFGSGTALQTLAFMARASGTLFYLTPWKSSSGNEWLLLSHLCDSAAKRVFANLGKQLPLAQASWDANRNFLAQVPTFSKEDEQLVAFLEERWLAKATGFFPILTDWICPCFDVAMQVHPDTENNYARNPFSRISATYQSRVEAWRERLPHPEHYPLILTRSPELGEYLPNKIHKRLVDLTDALPLNTSSEEWQKKWREEQSNFDEGKDLCFQRLEQKGIGGIRILPFENQTPEEIEHDHQRLLEWIGFFGLTANRVELDRLEHPARLRSPSATAVSVPFQSREALRSSLNTFRENSSFSHPQKALMFEGTLDVLQGLLTAVSEETWQAVMSSPTRSIIAQYSFSNIQKQLHVLIQEKEGHLFFDTMSTLELIHADISALIEVFSPYANEDFEKIYLQRLKTLPTELKKMTACALHASGMNSLAGVIYAVSKVVGRSPRLLFGENVYFECIKIGNMISRATLTEEATDQDWSDVDIILAQYNPVLRRLDRFEEGYGVEDIKGFLERALANREGRPLTLALDSTIDYIDSPRTGELLQAFQEEIKTGLLSVVCLRSGLKFDLFGMDNYSGAPLFMVHNGASHWAPFERFLTDPVLVTDRLSHNWFCLAYQYAAPTLETYRKTIFDNTRALLDKIPKRLYAKESPYRVIPFQEDADASFVDIKITGPFHNLRGAALAAGLLYLKAMEHGHPIFYRLSFGYYHPNFSMLFSKENATIRLTLGLDSDQVDVFVKIFETMDLLNGVSPRDFVKNLLNQ